MTKLTRVELEQENQRLTIDNTYLLQALQDVATNKAPDAVAKARDQSGNRWELRLYRSTGAAGGLVVSFFYLGSHSGCINVTVNPLDDLTNRAMDLTSSYDEALMNLRAERNRLCTFAVRGGKKVGED